MTTRIRAVPHCVATVALALLLAAASAHAGQWHHIEGAQEARALHFEPSPTAPTHVRIEAHGDAGIRRLELDPDFSVRIRGKAAPRSILPRRDGRPGTIIYDLETGRVVRILW
jgi:hypothetical protein